MLLGYDNKFVYCSVVGYTLLLSLIEYKTLVMRGDLERANTLLPSIPKEQHNRCHPLRLFENFVVDVNSNLYVPQCLYDLLLACSVAHFLESRGMLEEALDIATDPNYRFDLAVQLGSLEVAKA